MSERKITPVAAELIAAKKRIEDPENWHQGSWSDGHGRMCARGAFKEPFCHATLTLQASCTALYGKGIILTNDEEGHGAIIRAFDHAIQRALSEGK